MIIDKLILRIKLVNFKLYYGLLNSLNDFLKDLGVKYRLREDRVVIVLNKDQLGLESIVYSFFTRSKSI